MLNFTKTKTSEILLKVTLPALLALFSMLIISGCSIGSSTSETENNKTMHAAKSTETQQQLKEPSEVNPALAEFMKEKDTTNSSPQIRPTPEPVEPPTSTSPTEELPVPVASGNPQVCSLPPGETIQVGFLGYPNTLRALVPEGSTTQTPLHVSLHGAKSTIWEHVEATGMDSHTNTRAGITIYPRSSTDEPWKVSPGSTDVMNVISVISELHKQGCGSPATTTISGYSMGAMLLSSILCENPTITQTAAFVAGVLPPTPTCVIPETLKIFIQHGLHDPIVNFNGSITQQWVRDATGADWQTVETPNLNKLDTALAWAALKNCTPAKPETITTLDINLTTCEDVAPTRLVIHEGYLHEWETNNTPQGWTNTQIFNLAQM